MALVDVVRKILADRQLKASSGLPVYAYRLTEREIEALRSALAEKLRWGTHLDHAEAGGFCLFAAAWFCESQTSGAWAWEEIQKAIGFTQPYSELYGPTERGLRHLGRPLLRDPAGHILYLRTLACEGGLPRRLISQDGAYLRRFLARSVRVHEEYADLPVEEVCATYETDLPRTLRNDTVRELAVRLVTGIVELRRFAHGAGDGMDPIAYLDQRRPGWDQQIPLRIDNKMARDLLEGLLRQPASRPGSPASGFEHRDAPGVGRLGATSGKARSDRPADFC